MSKSTSLLLSLALIPAVTLSSISYALEGKYNIDAYAGVESNIRKMPFKKHFGSSVFKNSFYKGLNVYVGYKMSQYFGLEAGYEISDTKAQSKRENNGPFLFGERLIESHPGLNSIQNIVYAKSKIDGLNINLIGFLPLISEKNINLIGSVGLGYLRSNTLCILSEVGEKNIEINEGENISVQRFAMTESRFKNRALTLRASTGIQYLVKHNFGIRAIVSWENTHKIKICGVDGLTGKKVNEHARFRDGVTYRIGLFVPF